MAENIDDYAAIGQAVTANQAAVSDSIQRLRAQAYAAGALRVESAADGGCAAGTTADLCDPAGESAGRLRAAVQPDGGLCCAEHGVGRCGIADLVWRGHWYWGADFQPPALGMGRMGMELGTRRLLQPRHLGRMARRVSTAESLVPSATDHLDGPARIRRQLALSPAKLHASAASSTGCDPAGSGKQAGLQTACESPSQHASTEPAPAKQRISA